jgi:histidinol-phosphate aminotransferase
MAFADEEIITVFNNIKYPYNLSGVTQQLAMDALKNNDLKDRMISDIIRQRSFLEVELAKINLVEKVYPSEANFLLVRVSDARFIYEKLIENKIIVRNRSNLIHCENCLRITVGSEEENKNLINQLKGLDK